MQVGAKNKRHIYTYIAEKRHKCVFVGVCIIMYGNETSGPENKKAWNILTG
jgi:hypothetical protein